eukprot:TRINITY_DN2343_c1_g1_i2.p1 TRINITY_DN2343_c1_g1~~TRINITY_DN2343_c1_g1_i2.p1  ORF type:complete len:318 (+),score=55.66 TRINITY_DN2343_c1_g1_i2:58-1011(+)
MLSLLFYLAWILRSCFTYSGKSCVINIVSVFGGYKLSEIEDKSGDAWKKRMLLGGIFILLLSIVACLYESGPGNSVVYVSIIVPIVLMPAAIVKPKFTKPLIGACFVWVVTAPAITTLIRYDEFIRFSINDVICYSVSGGVLTSLLMLRPKSDCDSSSSILMMFINLVAIIHSICGLFIASLGSRGGVGCGIIMSVDALVTVGYTMPQKVSPQVISLLKGILVPFCGIVTLGMNPWYAGVRYGSITGCFIFGIGVHHIAAVFFTDLWFRSMGTITEELNDDKDIDIKDIKVTDGCDHEKDGLVKEVPVDVLAVEADE